MYSLRLLFFVLIIPSANLFGIKDLITFLPPKRQKQVMQDGYDLVNAKLVAMNFLLAQDSLMPKAIRLAVMSSINELFRHRQYRGECFSGTQIYQSIMNAAPLSLTKFMSPVESSRVIESGGYYPDQLNEGLRRFLLKNCAALSDEKIQKIKQEFNDKYFKDATSGTIIAPQLKVDFDLCDISAQLCLPIDEVAIPEVQYCAICQYDIEEDQDSRSGFCHRSHVFHDDCIAESMSVNYNQCPLCKHGFYFDPYISIDPDEWFFAVSTSNIDAVTELIGSGRDVNAIDMDGKSALIIAVYNNNYALSMLLLENGANPNVYDTLIGRSALMVAAARDNVELVRMLIAHGANLNYSDRDGYTSVGLAVERGHVDTVRLLIEGGASTNAVGVLGCTALWLAVEYGHVDVIKLLLDLKAVDVEFSKGSSYTALGSAANKGNIDAVLALLDGGACPNIADHFGRTALGIAAENGHAEVVRLLLKGGAAVNFTAEYNCSPLLLAARNGHLEAVRQLLKNNADVRVVYAGKTAVGFAMDGGHAEIVELLRVHGAKE